MIVLISGASHTGKTLLAQKLLEKYHYPYLSIDHLKMGLIRSKQTALTLEDDEKLIPYLWGITKEIIRTALENGQNLIVEGAYIPFTWKEDFLTEELVHIRFCCLIMSQEYILTHCADMQKYASIIENRQNDEIDKALLIKENQNNLAQCEKYRYPYVIITNAYPTDIPLLIHTFFHTEETPVRNIISQYQRPKKLILELGEIWKKSVASTHRFLTKEDKEKLYPLVLDAVKNVPFLLTAQNEKGEFIGFMGIENDKLEMLFIHPDAQKQGLGKCFVEHAKNAYKIRFVDVNEENPDAFAFYQKMGFRQFARSEYDGLGNHFPLLHLKLEK